MRSWLSAGSGTSGPGRFLPGSWSTTCSLLPCSMRLVYWRTSAYLPVQFHTRSQLRLGGWTASQHLRSRSPAVGWPRQRPISGHWRRSSHRSNSGGSAGRNSRAGTSTSTAGSSIRAGSGSSWCPLVGAVRSLDRRPSSGERLRSISLAAGPDGKRPGLPGARVFASAISRRAARPPGSSGFQDPYGNRSDLHRYPVRLVASARIRHDQGVGVPRRDPGRPPIMET